MFKKNLHTLWLQAQAAGLMSAGYVWIATDGVTNLLETLGPTVLDSMEGVLGVRSHVPQSNALASFTSRWRARFARDNPAVPLAGPTIYQLWAYDATWAVALAVQKAGKLDRSFTGPPRGSNISSDLAQLGVSRSGPKFLNSILGAQFRGLAGDFKLVDGQLQSSAFEIVNVVGKGGGRTVGFWSPAAKITKTLNNGSDSGLKTVIWPGDLKEVPKGWEIPTNGKKLKIGVPIKHGFNQFVDVKTDNDTGRVTATGYCIDVFEAVIKALPYSVTYDYVSFDGDSYDALVSQVYYKVSV